MLLKGECSPRSGNNVHPQYKALILSRKRPLMQSGPESCAFAHVIELHLSATNIEGRGSYHDSAHIWWAKSPQVLYYRNRKSIQRQFLQVDQGLHYNGDMTMLNMFLKIGV